MQLIINELHDEERALYAAQDVLVKDCAFDGLADGESAFKEGKDVAVDNCFFNLRYPFWHDTGLKIENSEMTELCRAALWYTRSLKIKNSEMFGIKALRECSDVDIRSTKIVSPEFGWKSRDIYMKDCDIESEYLFLLSSGIKLDGIKFKGKYSFQYVENVTIENSMLDTKDAFWHSKNVTVRNSVVKGEYLAWYSENLTLENCKIIGTQPLCYCKNLRLVDCETEGCDFSFEYSDAEVTVLGNILSVKNPKSGRIIADSIGEIILTPDSKYPCNAEIKERIKA